VQFQYNVQFWLHWPYVTRSSSVAASRADVVQVGGWRSYRPRSVRLHGGLVVRYTISNDEKNFTCCQRLKFSLPHGAEHEINHIIINICNFSHIFITLCYFMLCRPVHLLHYITLQFTRFLHFKTVRCRTCLIFKAFQHWLFECRSILSSRTFSFWPCTNRFMFLFYLLNFQLWPHFIN